MKTNFETAFLIALVLAILVTDNVSADGSSNTRYGNGSLPSTTNGSYNTAFGENAIPVNSSSGSANTGIGFLVLRLNTRGDGNTATGAWSLFNSTIGSYNTAFGVSALYGNTTGNSNVALGFHAGINLTTGSNNIDIGNLGSAGESNTIRIGKIATHKATYIAGIYAANLTGTIRNVVVNKNGRLGYSTTQETEIATLKTKVTALESILAAEAARITDLEAQVAALTPKP
jgi:hypothetical protein